MQKDEWYIRTDRYLNATEYSVCTRPANEGAPVLCIGTFKGIDQLRGFADMLKEMVDEGRAIETAAEECRQIIDLINGFKE